MTKKDYELIGKILRLNKGFNPSEQWETIVNDCVTIFGKEDPKFQPNKFLQACGIGMHDGVTWIDGKHFIRLMTDKD